MTQISRITTGCIAATMFIGIMSAQAPAPQAGGRGRGQQGGPPARVMPKPEEIAKIREKTEQIEKLVAELKAKHADANLLNDVEVYAKAGRFLKKPKGMAPIGGERVDHRDSLRRPSPATAWVVAFDHKDAWLGLAPSAATMASASRR